MMGNLKMQNASHEISCARHIVNACNAEMLLEDYGFLMEMCNTCNFVRNDIWININLDCNHKEDHIEGISVCRRVDDLEHIGMMSCNSIEKKNLK